MRELRLVLLGLAALVAMLLGTAFLMRALKQPPSRVAAVPIEPTVPLAPSALSPQSLASARGAVEQAIADSPDYTRFFDRLRLVFPGEYETIVSNLAVAVSRVPHASNGEGSEAANADIAMADAVAALRKAHGSLAAKASDEALAQIFVLQLREAQALALRDPHLCVAFLYGASGTGFLAFAADHRPLIADAAIAGLDAMVSGRMEQVQRSAPSDSDFTLLDKALVDKGLTRPEIDALLDGKTASPPIADEAMCKAGQVYLSTLGSLPADARARLYGLAVDLMAKS